MPTSRYFYTCFFHLCTDTSMRQLPQVPQRDNLGLCYTCLLILNRSWYQNPHWRWPRNRVAPQVLSHRLISLTVLNSFELLQKTAEISTFALSHLIWLTVHSRLQKSSQKSFMLGTCVFAVFNHEDQACGLTGGITHFPGHCSRHIRTLQDKGLLQTWGILWPFLMLYWCFLVLRKAVDS